MRRAWMLVTLLAVACKPAPELAPAGDFTVLAQSAEGYAQAQPGQALVFPRDHGAHPAYRIEWWYLTANLRDRDGREYGVQWTLFRSALATPDTPLPANTWQTPQMYMAHFAITTPDGHRAFQRYARGGEHGGLAQAGATAEPFAAWLDDWSLRSSGPDWLPLQVQARQGQTGLHLRLDTRQPLVLQGDNGFSRKHPAGGGSYYYSQPFLQAEGALELDGVAIDISGQAWLDREWSSQFLQGAQTGWDWLALHLDSGEKLMLFRLRGGVAESYTHGVLIGPDGGKTQLDSATIHLQVLATSEVAGRDLPLHWRIDLPTIGRSLEVRALHPDQWMEVDYAYWEGVVVATGDGPGNSGRGYLELTGY